MIKILVMQDLLEIYLKNQLLITLQILVALKIKRFLKQLLKKILHYNNVNKVFKFLKRDVKSLFYLKLK